MKSDFSLPVLLPQAGPHLIRVLLCTSIFLYGALSWGENRSEDYLIDVEFQPNVILPYKERRPTWGWLWSFQQERLYPDKYVSPGDLSSYVSIFGENAKVGLNQLSLGPKFNFSFFSFGISLLYGTGQVQSVSEITDTVLKLEKFAIEGILIFDTLFSEPYVAPYGFVQYYRFNYKEVDLLATPPVDVAGPTDWALAYGVGLLLQLNWIDFWTAHAAAQSMGLNNTYLDVFASKYESKASSSSAVTVGQEPCFQTGVNWGIGLRLEY